MALNLVSAYGSDSDESENDSAGETVEAQAVETALDNDNAKTSYFFGGDNGADSGDDSDDDGLKTAQAKDTTQTVALKRKLPSAAALLHSKRVGSSVFVSEEQREENEHAARLSQHVKMTDAKRAEDKRKPICRAFQKGRCKRGDRCQFRHPPVAAPSKDAPSVESKPKMYETVEEAAGGNKKPRRA